MKLKISQFSKLSQVTVKTLRYYDEIGLLKPAAVDLFTSYRFYTPRQLPRLRRIMALKGMGFALQEIGRILDDDLPTEQLRQQALLKRADLAALIEQQQQRLHDLDHWLRQLELELTMTNYAISTKAVETVSIAYIRGRVANQAVMKSFFDEAFKVIIPQVMAHDAAAGSAMGMYHDEEFTGVDIDTSVAMPLSRQIPATEPLQLTELPATTVVWTTHHGSYDTIGAAYDTLLQWISEKGYTIIGAPREHYHEMATDGDHDKNVTEVQFPVILAQG